MFQQKDLLREKPKVFKRNKKKNVKNKKMLKVITN